MMSFPEVKSKLVWEREIFLKVRSRDLPEVCSKYHRSYLLQVVVSHDELLAVRLMKVAVVKTVKWEWRSSLNPSTQFVVNVRRAFKWPLLRFDVNVHLAVSLISKAHKYKMNNASMMRFALECCEKEWALCLRVNKHWTSSSCAGQSKYRCMTSKLPWLVLQQVVHSRGLNK
jgi:hypothetical protein